MAISMQSLKDSEACSGAVDTQSRFSTVQRAEGHEWAGEDTKCLLASCSPQECVGDGDAEERETHEEERKPDLPGAARSGSDEDQENSQPSAAYAEPQDRPTGDNPQSRGIRRRGR